MARINLKTGHPSTYHTKDPLVERTILRQDLPNGVTIRCDPPRPGLMAFWIITGPRHDVSYYGVPPRDWDPTQAVAEDFERPFSTKGRFDDANA